MKLTLFVAIGAATMGGGCRNSGTDSPSAVPDQVHGSDNDLVTSGGNVVRCSPLEGGAMPSLVDDTWVTVDPGHELIPVRFKVPRSAEGKLYSLSETSAIYALGLKSTGPRLIGSLQFGVDSLQSPEDFVAEEGETIHQRVGKGTLGGRAATTVCGTIETAVPFAVMQGASGGVEEVAAHLRKDRYRDNFVPVGDHVFRASYRLPDAEATEWEPVFKAILSTVTWKE